MPPTLRLCDRCGYKVAPGTPRTRVGDEMLCAACTTSAYRKEAAMTAQVVRKFAHDSGDGQTIYHCFSCGSGKVIARSDRSTECMYCGVVFTVQVQPQFAAFPQTIDGMPVPVPGMPGQIDQGGPPPPGAPEDMDESGIFPPGSDAAADGGEENPFASVDGDEEAEEDEENGDEEEDEENPFAKKKSYRTSLGHRLDEDDFVRHLAIRHSVDARAMASVVKGLRQE